MIQRIQTIFLFLASGAAFGLFGLPFASTASNVPGSTLFADALYSITDHPALLGLFCAAGGLALISIFMFRNRKSQMLVGRIAIIANILGLVLAIILFMQDKETLGSAEPNDGLGLYLPLVFLVFSLLAQRNIQKDDKLVSSMDRLR
ncbi:MAG: DUF4293 domain-containing protein [Saprospiraceae bacterium]|nr:DUF4293 domain-containing protein [Saprospiraceae bacterium]